MDSLDEEAFICIHCGGEFDISWVTWPQYDLDGEAMIESDLNNRSREESVCYDCAE